MRFQAARRSGTNTRSLASQGRFKKNGTGRKKKAKLKLVPMLSWFVIPIGSETENWILTHDKKSELVVRRDKAGVHHKVYQLTEARMFELCQARQSPANLRFEAFQEEAPGGVIVPMSCSQVYGCRKN